MRKLCITAFIAVLMNLTAKAQILQPVHWSYAAKKLKANEAVLFFKASINPGWHLYSQFVKEGGPVKTTFTFDKANTYLLIGPVSEPKPIVRNEQVFHMDVSFFENEVIFRQKIKLRKPTGNVKGKIEFMTCDDKQCLPPEVIEFNIPVK